MVDGRLGAAMLVNHRRTLVHALVLMAAMVAVFAAVGRHPPSLAPETTVPFVGEWDMAVYRAMDDIRTGLVTALARMMDVLGAGIVTIPFRIGIALWLAARRRWRALAAWLATWAVAEIALGMAKPFFHRGRPPEPLVSTVGYSFPSGHAVAGASIAVALVLVLMDPGTRRRTWGWFAVGFAFVMALSRVYLHAHWLSDVVAGVLLGSSVALASAAIVTEIHDHVGSRRLGTRAHAAEGPAP